MYLFGEKCPCNVQKVWRSSKQNFGLRKDLCKYSKAGAGGRMLGAAEKGRDIWQIGMKKGMDISIGVFLRFLVLIAGRSLFFGLFLFAFFKV